jgi:DUF2075 family protein/phage repressor protein C with HTH and peptisase S24 domain
VIVYQATKDRFLKDAFERDIHEVVGAEYMARTGKRVSPSEFASWKESLMYMAKVLNDDAIPTDSGVAIEYGIPQSVKRVDFIISGLGENRSTNVIIVELKRWSKVQRTEKDGIVKTYMGGGNAETNHPSYQAWSYAALLQGFNEAVYEGKMMLQPCAYLHNYARDGEITHSFYSHYIDRAPLFLKGDAERNKLREFIKQYVKYGDGKKAIYEIENGRIRPSKTLVDSLVQMMKGKQEFVLIDEQKLAYENALAIAKHASESVKRVMLIEGGPGTGKSIVAINLLVALSKLGLLCRYVSKNAAPRAVYRKKLTGSLRANQIDNFFSGSGVFTEARKNEFDVLIVDEAHRLNEKSGLYGNLGENQIKELISASKSTIFFVDEDQRVTLRDIGHKAEIEKWAKKFDAKISSCELSSQFRCNGSDGYLAWLDDILEIRPTAKKNFDVTNFDFQVVDSPNVLRDMIRKSNKTNNKSRLVAGYCWNWVSRRHPGEYDVVIPEHDFKMKWNLAADGSLWIVAPNSIEEIGCIHTSQGLEVDYIGVVVGPDFVVRDGKVVTHPERRARSDKSLSGYRRMLGENAKAAKLAADRIIKNTYRTLMTRGMKGCYVFFTDPETAEYFKSRLGKEKSAKLDAANYVVAVARQQDAENVLPFERVDLKRAKPFVNAVPLLDLKIAAGQFSATQFESVDHEYWAILPSTFRPRKGLFVAQVVGESMNRRIANGAWCLFRSNPVGTRNGRIVVAEHRSIHDPDTGGSYTVKVYQSTKEHRKDGSWRHLEVRLRPDSDNKKYKELVFGPKAAGSVRIIAELIADL